MIVAERRTRAPRRFRESLGETAGGRGLTVVLLAACLLGLPGSAVVRADTTGGNEVVRETLENGLRVVVVRNALAPVVTTELTYLVGSNEAPAGLPGMAHALEHMMFRGSADLSADQLAAIAAAMGGQFDAATQQAVTQYMFTVPAEDLEVALHIEAIRMRSILAAQALWERERGAINQEVAQDLSSPQYVAYTKLLAALFKGTPYAHDALGSRASFAKTTGAMLRKFHDTWYAPNNAVLVLVGDVEPASALEQVRRFFSKIPSRPLPARPAERLEPVTAQTFELGTDLPYGLVFVAFRMPGSGSPDYAAARVLADALSSQRGDLYAMVADGRALDAGFTLDQRREVGIGYAVAAFPRGSDPGALLAEVRRVLAETARAGAPGDLVEAAKLRQVAHVEFQKDSVPGLAEAWAEAVAVEGRQSPEEVIEAINAVTTADVGRVARAVLDPAQSVVAILRPQSSGKPVSSKGFGGKEAVPLTQGGPVRLPSWAEASLSRLTVPPSALHPVVTRLPNGLQLIVQPESISRTVRVYGRIRNNADLETPPGQDGVDEVLDRLLSFGTTSLDRLEYQRELDRIAADASAGTDFSLEVLADNFERGVELLADNQLRPALPAAAFEIVRRQVASSLAGRLESPDYLAGRALRAALFPKGDPTLREATPATVGSVTLDAVRGYFGRVFRPDLTTIVVIGAVTPERAQTVIGKYFGGARATGPAPETVLPPVPRNARSATVVPDTSRVQDKVILAETLGLDRSNPDYYALELGNRVLGGSFYATRLYRDLREEAGLVYYVESTFDVGKTRALYVVEYGCDPPNVSRARAIVERNLRDMQRAPVGPDELRRAKALSLRHIPLSESGESEIAGRLIYLATRDLPLDEPVLAAHRYVELTAEQVRAAFARWVATDALVQVTEGPAPR
jgi:zinc protease